MAIEIASNIPSFLLSLISLSMALVNESPLPLGASFLAGVGQDCLAAEITINLY
jgi:hypothetical protein